MHDLWVPWEACCRASSYCIAENGRMLGLKHNKTAGTSDSLSVLQHKPGHAHVRIEAQHVWVRIRHAQSCNNLWVSGEACYHARSRGIVDKGRMFGLKYNKGASSSDSLSVLHHKPGHASWHC